MNWIDEVITEIIKRYNTSNPYAILQSMNIKIVKVNKKCPILLEKHCIYIVDFSTVYIRDDLMLSNELFYLCHELGHIILHGCVALSIADLDRMEKQADYFAYKLSCASPNRTNFPSMNIKSIACNTGYRKGS